MAETKELIERLRATRIPLCWKAADTLERLSAPVEGMETTEEERARWSKNLADEGRGTTLTNETCRRLLRDITRLQAEVARLLPKTGDTNV